MKSWKKRTISIALACMLLLALLPAGAMAAGWESHWSAEYMQTAKDSGWLTGEEEAGAPVTGTELAAMLAQAGKAAVTAIHPDDALTRQEALTMIAQAFDLTAEDKNAAAGFADWAEVAEDSKDAVAALVEKGIVNGVGGNRLAPAQSVTLGEVCKVLCACMTATGGMMSADDAIAGVTTIGFVDTDGAKTSAIVVEYKVDLTGAAVDVGTYEINDYGTGKGDSACEIGSNPGVAVKAYVNDKAEISAQGGAGTGKYVIIEVNTDYQFGSVANPYRLAMYADVLQTGTIRTETCTITPGAEKIGNYTVTEVNGRNGTTYENYANDGAFTFPDLEKFQLFTKEAGTAFHATGCWEELDGASYDADGDHIVDVDLPYALYVPEDYDASKEYGLVLQIHDAGFMGEDPMITLTESQGSVNFASEKSQQIMKDQGLGGLIVVAPQIAEELRSTRDNWSLSAAVPATWQLMDYLTETYNISEDHIYGTGQSMGGMQIVAMAAQRDNYFAGLWANGCQWGTNYNLEEVYADRGGDMTCTAAPADGEIIWTKDADGNECDYRNWYYMISDDNVLITNCQGDTFSSGVWQELNFLYQDLAGVPAIPKAVWNPLTDSREAQNAAANALFDAGSDTGFYWTAFEGGNHMATWIYSHGVEAHTQWLLTQTRESEMKRDKLPLNKPFVAAAEQIQTEDRLISPDAEGNNVYYVTGQAGAGTADYNGYWSQMGRTVIKMPNWKPSK